MSEYISDRDLSSIGETSMAAYAGLTVTDGGICLQRTELPQTITQAGALDTEAAEDKTDNRFEDNHSVTVESSEKELTFYERTMADILSRTTESIDTVIKDPATFDRLFEEWMKDGGGAFPLVPGLSDATDRLIESISKNLSVILDNNDTRSLTLDVNPEFFSKDVVDIKNEEFSQSVKDYEFETTDSKDDMSDKKLSFYERTTAYIQSNYPGTDNLRIKDHDLLNKLTNEAISNGGKFRVVRGMSDYGDSLLDSISKMMEDSPILENSMAHESTSTELVLDVKSDVFLQSVEDHESKTSDSKDGLSDKKLSFYERTMAYIQSNYPGTDNLRIKDHDLLNKLTNEAISNGGKFRVVRGMSDYGDSLIDSFSESLSVINLENSLNSVLTENRKDKLEIPNSHGSTNEEINRYFNNYVDVPFSVFDISIADSSLYGSVGLVGGISDLTWIEFEGSTASNYCNARILESSNEMPVIDAEKCSSDSNDNLKCWAAADSNMLYRTGWITSETTTEDKIFDRFRDSFYNGDQGGGHPVYGAEWYLSGFYAPLVYSDQPPFNERDYDMCSSGTGEYFPSTVSDIDHYLAYGLIHNGINSFVEDAITCFENGLSVSIGIDDSANPEIGHILTLHGITYNVSSSGTEKTYDLKSIIVSDSDDDSESSNPEDAPNILKVIPVSTQNGNLVLNPDYYYATNGSHTIIDYTVLFPARYTGLLYVDPGLSFVSLEQYGATLLNQNVISDRRLIVSSAGLAMNTTVFSGGTQNVFADGTALNTILSSGGVMNVFSGGSTSFVQIQSGGSMIVSSGAIVSGEVKLGGTMIVSGGANGSGATVNYQVKDRTTSDAAMLTNPGYLTSASFAATVSGNEAFDSYQLANGVPANYSGASFAMYKGSDLIGTLSVGSGTLSTSYRLYSLKAENNILSMDVTEKPIKSDRDHNRISDVMFVWKGEHGEGNHAHGYWMNGSDTWWSANAVGVDPAWDNLGSYDMCGDGKADAVMFGNVVINNARGAYIGYYQDGDDANGWVTIGYLNNEENIAWQNKVGNLTGNTSGANSIVWHAPELGALGVWTDGTTNWVGITGWFDENWTMLGCGDFNGDGKDSVLMSLDSSNNRNNSSLLYSVDLDGTLTSLGNADWFGWDVRAIGDFSGDGKDDIILFENSNGEVKKLINGNADNSVSLGNLNDGDKIVGCGDYDGDCKDDLLVQKSQGATTVLGYYSEGILDSNHWNGMGTVTSGWEIIA